MGRVVMAVVTKKINSLYCIIQFEANLMTELQMRTV